MREPQQQTLRVDDEATLVVGGEETTLVAPRFDDEETLVARPVVPIEDGGHDPTRGRHSRSAPRRSWSLVLVSVLIGGVLGGAGLYLYQRQSQDPAVSPAAMTQPTTPADAAQAPPVPAEAQPTAPSVEEPQAQQTEASTAAAAPHVAKPTATPEPDEEVPAATRARAPESVPAAERRTAPSEGTPRRGKRGNRDEEPERRHAPRPDDNLARDEEPEARQVDTIFYRQRRAERRAERRAARRARRAEDSDRLRRIFEGSPQ